MSHHKAYSGPMNQNQLSLAMSLPPGAAETATLEAAAPRPHLDFPFRTLDTKTLADISLSSARWARRQSLRSLHLHGIR